MSKEAGPVQMPDETRGSAVRAAMRGAALTGSLILLVAAWRGVIDPALIAAAVLGLLLSAFPRLRRRRARGSRPLQSAPPRPALADDLLATIPDPVILVDRRVVVVEANEAALSLLPALKIRHPLSFALRSPDVLDGIGQALKTGETVRVEYVDRIPTERAFEVQIGPLRTSGEGRGGVVLVFRDLTSARRLEHMRVDFVANASHELRTPLASLLGFIETLQGPARNDPAARDRFLEIMREQARRMTRLIDDLLSLSRIEMKAHMRPDTPVDLAPLVGHMIETLSPLARERGVTIALDGPGEGLVVLADRDEMLRLVENLVENAVKYGGGRVDVGLRRIEATDAREAQIELSVRDYGPGIAPEHLPRLTERFYRVDVADSRQKGGTGLGLAIVKHIVAHHRGRLGIESDLGQGAVFRVTLPAQLGSEVHPA